MTYDPDLHHRRSIRLHGYDYSQPGAYYVTVCVQDHRCLLGEVVQGRMNHNGAGEMVAAVWKGIPKQFPAAELDEYIVMPNHCHRIIRIVGAPLVGARHVRAATRAGTRPAPTGARDSNRPKPGAPARGAPTLGEMVGAFKSNTTNGYIRGVREQAWTAFNKKFWQRNFYEHIIRNDDELQKIRDYIRHNPLMWECDRYNPDRAVLVADDEGRLVPWNES